MKLDTSVSRVNLSALIGEHAEKTDTAFQLRYTADKAQAEEALKDLGNTKGSTFVAAYFGIKPNTDDFAVGELSAVLKDILLVAKKELKLNDFKTAIVNKNGVKYYMLGVFVSESLAESVQSISEAIGLKKFELDLGLSQTPSRTTSTDPLGMKLNFNAEIPRGAVDLLKYLNGDKEDGKSKNQNASYGIQLLEALLNLDLTMKFLDLKHFYQGIMSLGGISTGSEDLEGKPFGWDSIRRLIATLVASFLPDLPQNFQDAYYSTSNTLSTLDKIVASTEGHSVVLETKNFQVTELLPTKEEVAEHMNDFDGEDDDSW